MPCQDRVYLVTELRRFVEPQIGYWIDPFGACLLLLYLGP